MNILTYGTFDTMHWGHIQILKRAAEMGNSLYVGVSSDKFNKIKNKKSYLTESTRVEMIRCLKFVSHVFLENDWDQKINDIKKYEIDVLVMGDDWKGKFDNFKELGIEVVYLPRTKSISSTQIKDILKNE